VHVVNWMLPARRHIRVLLGVPPIDWSRVHGEADAGYVLSFLAQRDAHYMAVVEREVLRKWRRARLIVGNDHLLRGLHSSMRADCSLSAIPAPSSSCVVAARYSEQADAVLYVGPSEVLTASRAEPAIYQVGRTQHGCGGSARSRTSSAGRPMKLPRR
jgi:hypothetical protein